MSSFMLMPFRPKTNLERQQAFCARNPGYYTRLKRRKKQTQAMAFAAAAAKKSTGTAMTVPAPVPAETVGSADSGQLPALAAPATETYTVPTAC